MKLLPAQQFQATGPDGVVWSFDPFSGKWTVNQNGKQSSSQKFETLTQKLEQWKKAEKLVETPHEVREMELLRLRTNHSFSNSSLEVTNVRVRLEWNPKEEAYQVSKYLLRQEGAGWRSFSANESIFLNPFSPNPEVMAWVENLLLARQVEQRFLEAKNQLAQAWMTSKTSQLKVFALAKGGPCEVDVEQSRPSYKTQRFFETSAMVPLLFQSKEEAGKEHPWVVDSHGRWTLDGQKVWVRMIAPTRQHDQPKFVVGQGEPGSEEVMFSTPDPALALRLAHFTASEGILDLPASKEWVGHSPENSSHMSSWPIPMHIKATVVFEEKGGQDTVFSLQCTDPSYSKKQPSSLSQKPGQWEWVEDRGGKVAPTPRWNSGPEDTLCEAEAELEVAFESLREPRKQDRLLSVIHQQKSEQLASLMAEASEGENLERTPEEIMGRWKRLEQRVTHQVQGNELLEKAEAYCQKALASTVMTSAPAGRRKRQP